MVKVAIQKFGPTHWHFINASVAGVAEADDGDVICTLEPGLICEARDNHIDEIKDYPSYESWDEFADAVVRAYNHCKEKGWLPIRAGELVKIANIIMGAG